MQNELHKNSKDMEVCVLVERNRPNMVYFFCGSLIDVEEQTSWSALAVR